MGHLVLGGLEDATVWTWNAGKCAYLDVFSGHSSSVTCGDFTPDDTNLIMSNWLCCSISSNPFI